MAKKKTETLDERVLAALRPALAGQPLPLQASGKNTGIFPSGAAGKALAMEALNRGLVQQRDDPATAAKKNGKAKPHFSITTKGQEFVLEHDSPKGALEAVQIAVRQLSDQLSSFDRQSPGDENRILDGLQELFAQQFRALHATLQDAAAASRQAAETHLKRIDSAQQVIQMVEKAIERVSQQQSVPPPPALAVPQPEATPTSWGAKVVSFLRSRRDSGTPGDCPLPELYDFLHRQHPALSIGHFHDTLRQSHNDGRIRLSGWSGPLENLPHPNLAIFIAHKVMYYARLP